MAFENAESFEELTKKELLRTAELTETEVNTSDSKKEIVEALEANEINWEFFNDFIRPQLESEKAAEDAAAEEKANEPQPAANVVKSTDVDPPRTETTEEETETVEEAEEETTGSSLVKFVGSANHFERYGKRWSAGSPYGVIDDEELLEQVVDDPMFRLATSKEVRSFFS